MENRTKQNTTQPHINRNDGSESSVAFVVWHRPSYRLSFVAVGSRLLSQCRTSLLLNGSTQAAEEMLTRSITKLSSVATTANGKYRLHPYMLLSMKIYHDKLRQKTFHINCMHDYFESFASVNEERRNVDQHRVTQRTTSNRWNDGGQTIFVCDPFACVINLSCII